jgi:hypothetical protein
MKKIVYLVFGAALILCACNSTANKMADEMCQSMTSVDESDPMSKIEALSKLTEINEKLNADKKVSEEELISAMKKKCPEGAEKLEKIMNIK